jgi:hypothetical protein
MSQKVGGSGTAITWLKVGAGGTALAVLILLTWFDFAPKRPHGSASA